ncbi:hypothetical protein EIM48_11075 [Pseudoxanthomonas sp. SGNA-20]|uniref:hypothetical protein n=1 Tax=Pseudoxanthomonas sp. SGNA-20 TaxID=2493088 RepID=UPI000F62DAF9|nr:hypothetical protein [Pseudoxanthomonas sp. SGNA-20]RRN55296.1 hypothetical protein EIM48_11075 [Pseudoxanthomonas sp. SGNA-20]
MQLTDWKRILVVALLCLGGYAPAEAAGGDPVWGQYASLPGRTAAAGPDGYRLRWYWAREGEELVQEYVNPGDGRVAHSDRIRPDTAPGTLLLTGSYMGGKQWRGTVQEDGQVLFVGVGLLKFTYLAGFNDAGQWEIRRAKVKDGRPVSVEPATRYNRFFFEADGGTGQDAVAVAEAGTAGNEDSATQPRLPAEGLAAALPDEAADEVADSSGVAAAAPGPGPAMRELERFIGNRLLAADGKGAVQLRREGGHLVIELWDQDGQSLGRYVLAAAGRKGDKLQMLESAFGYKRLLNAHWFGNDQLRLSSYSGAFSGYGVRLRLVARADGLLVIRENLDVGLWGDEPMSVSRTVHYDLPPMPVLEGEALAAQNALNRGYWQALVNSERNAVEPGQWLLPNGEAAIQVSETTGGFRSRYASLGYGSAFTEQLTTVVFDDATGTWTVKGPGQPDIREYVEAFDGQTWNVRTLPGQGVTPAQAIAHSRRVVVTAHTLVLTTDTRRQFQWMPNGEVSVTMTNAIRRKQARDQQWMAELRQAQAEAAAREARWAAEAAAEAEWNQPAQPSAAWLALERAVDGAKAREAQSRADLHATYADVNRRAAEQRAQQAAAEANARAARDAAHAREVMRQEELARQARERERQALQARQAASQAQAYAANAAGTPGAAASASASASAQASTRERADACVGQPVTSPHQCGSTSGLKGIVSNECGAPVDVRMCFMTAGGWDCQVRYGLAPHATWEPGLCSANGGGVFRSVRYSDSKEPLATP